MDIIVEQQRHIALDGAFNFRDLGGYSAGPSGIVRTRQVYRADGIHRIAGADVERIRELELRTVIDLRTFGELDAFGRFPAHELGVDYHHLPIIESVWDAALAERAASATEFLADRYAEMLVVGAPSIRRIIELLADPGTYPVVFHCAAGKDRTGVVAAVLLALLDVPEGEIAHDYALSRLGMDRMIEWFNSQPGAAGELRKQPAHFLAAPPEAMLALLAGVRVSYGSMPGYVHHLGVPRTTVTTLRKLLVEPG